MILVRLMGGLGNQLFQYATAKALACRCGTSVGIDVGWYGSFAEGQTARKYLLGHFAISGSISHSFVAGLAKEKKLPYVGKSLTNKLFSLLPIPKYRYFAEKDFQFDPEVLRLNDNIYLDGYWQSEKYFLDYADIIRKEFTVNSEPDSANTRIAHTISHEESVAVHVRRGDYATHPQISAFHGCCSLDYYNAALQVIAAQIDNPSYYIFSDDPTWARQNLKFPGKVQIVEFNTPDTAYEDMRLMSLCKHHVIANSSFSWWGAWLSENQRKQVIAPKRWFNGALKDTRDLLPSEWLKL